MKFYNEVFNNNIKNINNYSIKTINNRCIQKNPYFSTKLKDIITNKFFDSVLQLNE